MAGILSQCDVYCAKQLDTHIALLAVIYGISNTCVVETPLNQSFSALPSKEEMCLSH